MNYCSIEDAWGKANIPSNQFNQYMDNKFSETKSCKTNKKVENFSETKKKLPKRVINYEDDYEEPYGCDNFVNHIKTCRQCYNRNRASGPSSCSPDFMPRWRSACG